MPIGAAEVCRLGLLFIYKESMEVGVAIEVPLWGTSTWLWPGGALVILSESSGVPYWRQIRDQFTRQIRGGALASGARLPSIRQLAGDLRLSIITVQKAYDELESEGLIVSKQGRGSFVCEGTGAASREEWLAPIGAELDALLGRAKVAGITREELELLVARALARTGLDPSTGACRTPAA